MLIPEFPSYPNYRFGVKSSGVSEQLAQVNMVGSFELVLNDDWPVAVQIGSEDI